MKYFKNTSKLKLSLGNIFMLPDSVAQLDEESLSVKPFIVNGYLKETIKVSLEVGTKLIPTPETSEPVSPAESVASKPEETSQVETGTSRGSLAAAPASTPGGKVMPKDAEVNRFAFTDDQGSVVSKGSMPGQGNEKPMAQFMTEALTVGQKDLGSVLDNSGTAVSEEPKKKTLNLEEVPEYLRSFFAKPYLLKKFQIAFSSDIPFLKDVVKYDIDDNVVIITSERIRELEEKAS